MKYTHSFLIVILGMMIGISLSFAQEDNVTTATSALEGVLTTLKANVQQLTLDNAQLADRDKAVQQQIFQLQAQLGQLQQQEADLNKAAEKLQIKNPSRGQQITRMEAENEDLDDRTQKAEAKIKFIQQSLDAGYQENQKLLLQLKGMPGLGYSQIETPQSKAQARQQKEKLKLMKMIFDSRKRQAGLHASILDYQKNKPLLPSANALAHQEILETQIKDLEGQIARDSQEKPLRNSVINNPGDDAQVRQLELELKDLEQNYTQLKSLLDQMNKKAQKAKMTVSQHVEELKLQNSVDDLKRQNVRLRADLDDLRSQMVDLDKRKSHLQTLIRQ